MHGNPEPVVALVAVALVFLLAIILLVCCCKDTSSRHNQGFAPAAGYSNVQLESRVTRVQGDTLDLHYLSWPNARSALDDFIRDKRHSCSYVYVITGQGNRSVLGQPVLRPMVQSYLDDKGYRYTFENQGKLKVYL